MKTVDDLDVRQFADCLESGLPIQVGPFAARIQASTRRIVEPLHGLYRDYPIVDEAGVFSFHVRLDRRRGWPRFYRPLVRFSVDGRVPHEDMPAEQALPVLEWGMNLVIALRSHCFLMLHAAALARGNRAMLLPAAPGSGKTTLCAGMALRGWRLFSDEFGLVRPGTTELVPVPRPMALKNESIDIVREFDAQAYIGPSVANTRKGTVAHLRPPSGSIAAAQETAPVSWIVFPRWAQGADCVITELSKQEAFMQLATNAFNYELLGEAGFETVARLIDHAVCLELEYSDLQVATDALTDLADRNAD